MHPTRQNSSTATFFFPLEQPTRITPGVQLSVEFRANLVGDDYLWQWNTQLREEGSHGQITVDSRQSTFFGAPLSPESLKKRAAGYTPSLNAEGKVLEFALNMMTTESSLAGIAQQLLEQFSGRFRDLNSALAYAGELAVKYG